jgi:hypothetical protein
VAVECAYCKGNDDYCTPAWVREGLFGGWFDPCPLGGASWFVSGLEVVWVDRTFVNPPYSDPLPWVEKAVAEHKKGKTVALLLKHDSSTRWFRLLHEAGAEFLMPQGRLSFSGKKAAPFPSVIAILYKEHF